VNAWARLRGAASVTGFKLQGLWRRRAVVLKTHALGRHKKLAFLFWLARLDLDFHSGIPKFNMFRFGTANLDL
jgi:hypothetical protein